MRTLLISALCCAAAFAQEASTAAKPPDEVDRALRARIAEFYQDQIDGRYRQAEQLVADDTKDAYYNASKPRFLSFEVKSIKYSEDFTHADVVTACEQFLMFPGVGGRGVKMDIPSTWKIQNGAWYWYKDPEKMRETPFGKLPTPGAPGAQGSPAIPAIPMTPDFALNKVKAEAQEVALKAGGSVELTFSNSAPGAVTVSLPGKPDTFEVSPERIAVKQAGKAAFTIKAAKDAKTAILRFQVDQTGEEIPVRVIIQ